MKFGQMLVSHLTPEWRKQYIHYANLKQQLYDIILAAPPVDVDEQERERYFGQMNEQFFGLCEDELKKINLFYGQQIAAADSKFNELKHELETFKHQVEQKPKQKRQQNKETKSKMSTLLPRTGAKPKDDEIKQDELHAKTSQQLKLAFSEFYLSLVLLQNYQQLNATGFRKILKKHDKILSIGTGLDWKRNRVEKAPFYEDKKIEALIESTENMVITELEEGNRGAAMKRLRVPPLSEKQHAWTTFRLGLYLGCFLVLVFLICISVIISDRKDRHEPKWLGVRLFRGFLVLFGNIWLMGLNMYGWQQGGVNHVLIFEIDPREHLTYQSLMEIASFFCMLWALCVLGYLHGHDFVPPLVFPLILMFFCLLWLCNPVKKPFEVMFRSSRYWFARHVFYCLTSPFHYVTFPDFWLADQMNSLVTFFLDMEYFVCFYATEVHYSHWNMSVIEQIGNSTSGIDFATGNDYCSSDPHGIRAIVSVIPALIRFLQCLRRFRDTRLKHPHLTNAGKYSTSFFVVAFGSLFNYYKNAHNAVNNENPFFYIWVLAYICSFAYTFMWDIWMDWGLMDPNAPKANRFLREELVYSSVWYYYFAICQDFVLRLSWVFNVSQGGAWRVEKDILSSVTAPFEIFRRFIWNYFRLENEHVNNCGQFRAVRDISIKPLRKSDLDGLIEKVDNNDGVTHRGQNLGDKRAKRKATKRGAPIRKLSRAIKQPFKQSNASASKLIEPVELSNASTVLPDNY